MNIVHLSETNSAYMPAMFVHLINKYTEHRAFLLQHKRFIFGNPLGITTPRKIDGIMDVLRNANVLHFHGSQIHDRRRFMGINIAEFYNKPYFLHYHGTPQRERAHRHQRAVPLLVSTPEMLKIFRNARYFPNLIDESHPMYLRRVKHDGNIRLCHHFSYHQRLKDTDIFNAASTKFRGNGNNINFELIPQMNLEDALQYRAANDIIFDHIQGYYGLISIEGMAQGLLVVNGANEHTKEHLTNFFGAIPPFYTTTRRGFVADVGKITKEMVEEYGGKGISFMDKHWSGKENIHRLIALYGQL